MPLLSGVGEHSCPTAQKASNQVDKGTWGEPAGPGAGRRLARGLQQSGPHLGQSLEVWRCGDVSPRVGISHPFLLSFLTPWILTF